MTQDSLFSDFDPITLWVADGALYVAIDAVIDHDRALQFSRIVRRNAGVKACKLTSTGNKWMVTFSRVAVIEDTKRSIRAQAEQFLKAEQTRPVQVAMF